jgi:hypothetical protein
MALYSRLDGRTLKKGVSCYRQILRSLTPNKLNKVFDDVTNNIGGNGTNLDSRKRRKTFAVPGDLNGWRSRFRET